MWIPLKDTLTLLLITAVLFYELPALEFKFRIFIIALWLGACGWLLYLLYKTDSSIIQTAKQALLVEI